MRHLCWFMLLLIWSTSLLLAEDETNPPATNIETQSEWYQEQRALYYGVPVQVRFKGLDAELAAQVWTYLEGIDNYFNDYRTDTEVGRLNAAPVGVYEISAEMREALLLSYQAHAISDGAFDITVGPLRRLWKEAAKTGDLPTQAAIDVACTQVGIEHVWLDGNKLYKNRADVSLDFGGIIKGLAVDRAMQLLIQAGKTDAMVQVGGETGAIGISPRGKAHAFAIPNPRQPDELLQVVQDKGTGYSGCTSANYRLPIIIGGKPFYHIFDPRTGSPCSVHVLSVSVVFPQIGKNALADSLSTSGVVLGPDKLIELVESLGGDCMIVSEDAEGRIFSQQSKTWQSYVRE